MELFDHQARVLESNNRFTRLIGGLGAGKSIAMASWAINMGAVNHPLPPLVIMPVYSQLQRVFLPSLKRIFREHGVKSKWHKTDKIVSYRMGRRDYEIWCASATEPDNIDGITCCGVGIDEYEQCPFELFEAANARMRDSQAKKTQMFLSGTLEGYNEWSDFVDSPKFDCDTIIAPTHLNTALPKEFIESMRKTMTDQQWREKVMGIRTPKTGAVYTRWDRTIHNGRPPAIDRNDDVEIWADFNVGKMAWCFAVWRKENGIEKAYIWRELVDEHTDTLKHGLLARQVMAEELSRYYGRNVTEDEASDIAVVVCDASGNARNTASKSDVGILHGLGFRVWHPQANPRVKDRVQSVQMALANGQLTIDMERAPYIARCIESQAYNKHGEPDKDPKRGLDHGSDAVGYGVYYRLPAQSYAANSVCYDGL